MKITSTTRNFHKFSYFNMLDRQIKPKLLSLATQFPVITITGPRQSGKTTLCRAVFPDHRYVNLEEIDTRRYARDDPRGFLQEFHDGVILDEIQRAPELPSYIQGLVDADQRAGRFILTGSEHLQMTETVSQSLAGRTGILQLLPLSYHEAYGQTNQAPSVDEVLYTGFYPRIHDKGQNPTDALSAYVATYVERDIRTLSNLKHLDQFERFVALCAANTGQLLNYTRLSNDIGVDQETVKSWLSLLKATFIVFTLPGYQRNIRKRLTKSPKLYFYDVGLAAYLLRIENVQQLNSHPLRGTLFENFVVVDYLKQLYNMGKRDTLYFFRDHSGNEVDLIHEEGISITVAEVKAGKTVTKDHFKGLTYFRGLVPESIKGSYLIYGGETTMERYETQVLSFREVSKMFLSSGVRSE
jgi:uncharacterized protein